MERSWVWLLALVPPCLAQYTPDWQSLSKRPLPAWYDDAKFGIFIHWGVYSVPSWAPVGTYAEWYWLDLMGQANISGPTYQFHTKTYGPNFKYPQFAERFTAELFDPDAWLKLIAASGAKYMVFTSKHHDGFCNWGSATSWNWNSVDIGPKRDLIAELFTAARKAGIRPGLYYSLYEWFHPDWSKNPERYVSNHMLPQLYELINGYKPEILWGDGEWEKSSAFWRSPEFIAWLYNHSPVKDSVVINDRWGNDTRHKYGGFFTPEYSSRVFLDHKWEENSGLDLRSYGLNRNTPADKYYTAQDVVLFLLRCVANGGNLLLNIGPSWDGTIPPIMQERLLQVGDWMKVSGDGIYGTKMWRVQHEGPHIDQTNVRYTHKPKTGVVFAFVLQWPEGGVVTLTAPLTSSTTTVSLLGYGKPLTWKLYPGGKGLNVTLPAFPPGRAPVNFGFGLVLKNVK